MKKTVLTYLLTALVASIFSARVVAQQLPKIQEASVRAPENIKIDGKADEWNNQFQAYNADNFLFYTISNDDENLYLAVRMNDVYGNKKIFLGGITFSVNTSTGKKLAITYPARSQGSGTVLAGNENEFKTLENSSENYKKLNKGADFVNGFIAGTNHLIGLLYKNIQTSGAKELKPLLPLSNQEGIKAAVLFNSQMQCVYELAIPLKYLGAPISESGKFTYTIKVNADPTILVKGFKSTKTIGPRTSYTDTDAYLTFPTYFSGQYTLTKM